MSDLTLILAYPKFCPEMLGSIERKTPIEDLVFSLSAVKGELFDSKGLGLGAGQHYFVTVFVRLTIKEDILKNVGNRAVLGHHWLP